VFQILQKYERQNWRPFAGPYSIQQIWFENWIWKRPHRFHLITFSRVFHLFRFFPKHPTCLMSYSIHPAPATSPQPRTHQNLNSQLENSRSVTFRRGSFLNKSSSSSTPVVSLNSSSKFPKSWQDNWSEPW